VQAKQAKIQEDARNIAAKALEGDPKAFKTAQDAVEAEAFDAAKEGHPNARLERFRESFGQATPEGRASTQKDLEEYNASVDEVEQEAKSNRAVNKELERREKLSPSARTRENNASDLGEIFGLDEGDATAAAKLIDDAEKERLKKNDERHKKAVAEQRKEWAKLDQADKRELQQENRTVTPESALRANEAQAFADTGATPGEATGMAQASLKFQAAGMDAIQARERAYQEQLAGINGMTDMLNQMKAQDEQMAREYQARTRTALNRGGW
jgi:hypothetical protein